MLEKKPLGVEEIEAQTAFELPDRAMMQQTGLVNVNIGDITVQLPVALAANVCDVNAAVLIGQIQDDGSAECTATAESLVS